MSEFEKIVNEQKPEPIEYSPKCLGCPRVQEKIQDIAALKILQQENIDLASAIMDESEREKIARDVAPLYAQIQGIPIEQIDELVEAIKQDYPKMIDSILSCIGAEEQLIRDEINSNTERCLAGPHRLIAFDSDGDITASGDICELDIPRKGERIVPAVIYPEIQIDKN